MRRGVLLSLVAAIVLIVPAAATAATGPAYFLRATGGTYIEALHPGGLTVYGSSPAYVVIRYSGSAAAFEHYASSNTFPAVGILNGGGTDCFVNARPVIVPFFISDFIDGRFEYHGLFMTYTSHFRLASTRPSLCRFQRANGPILPTVSLSKSSAKLSITCRIKYCNGRFAAFKPASTCGIPVKLLPGVFGCSPAYNGYFKVPGGLTDRLTIPLKGTRANEMKLVLVVNGKTVLASKISSVLRTPRGPARPKTSSVSIAAGNGTAGVSQTASGQISPHGRGAVVVTFTGPAGAHPLTVTVGADRNGRWRAAFTPPTAGAWAARAVFIGDRSRKASQSKTIRFTVALQKTTMTVACPGHATPGQNAAVSGTVSGGSGLPVTIVYTPPNNGTAIPHSVTTTSAGAYSDTVAIPANGTGTWNVTATFAGDSRRGAASVACSFAAP